MWLSQRKDGTFLIIFEFKFTGADVKRSLKKVVNINLLCNKQNIFEITFA